MRAADGWLRVEKRRVVGVVPMDRVVVRERAAVAHLQREAGRVLHGTVPMSRVEPARRGGAALCAARQPGSQAGSQAARQPPTPSKKELWYLSGEADIPPPETLSEQITTDGDSVQLDVSWRK